MSYIKGKNAAGWTGTFCDEGKFLFFLKALKRKKICKIGGLFNSHWCCYAVSHTIGMFFHSFNFVEKKPILIWIHMSVKSTGRFCVFLCYIVCIDGTFGFDCVNNCSGYCLNDSPCNKQTGHCDFGCYPGYTDDDYNRGANIL